MSLSHPNYRRHDSAISLKRIIHARDILLQRFWPAVSIIIELNFQILIRRLHFIARHLVPIHY